MDLWRHIRCYIRPGRELLVERENRYLRVVAGVTGDNLVLHQELLFALEHEPQPFFCELTQRWQVKPILKMNLKRISRHLPKNSREIRMEVSLGLEGLPEVLRAHRLSLFYLLIISLFWAHIS